MYSIYRIANPPFEESVARDLKLVWEHQSNGDMIENWDARYCNLNVCESAYNVFLRDRPFDFYGGGARRCFEKKIFRTGFRNKIIARTSKKRKQ